MCVCSCICMCMYVCVHMHMCVCMYNMYICAQVCELRCEHARACICVEIRGQFFMSVLSCYLMRSQDGTRVIRLARKHLYPPSHLDSPLDKSPNLWDLGVATENRPKQSFSSSSWPAVHQGPVTVLSNLQDLFLGKRNKAGFEYCDRQNNGSHNGSYNGSYSQNLINV